MCETVKPVVGGQSGSSLLPSVIKTEVPLGCDDLAHKDLLLQQYGERIEKLSKQDKWSKCCKRIPPDTAIHEQVATNKWLRKSVYNEKHTFNNGETIVDNNVNDATHVDMRNMQN